MREVEKSALETPADRFGPLAVEEIEFAELPLAGGAEHHRQIKAMGRRAKQQARERRGVVEAVRPTTLRAIFDRLTPRSRLAIDPIVESNSIDLLKRLARLSGLATVLTRADVEMERLGGTLTFVPILFEEVSWQTLVVLHRTSAQLSGLTMRFAEKLADVIQQIGDGGAGNRSFSDR